MSVYHQPTYAALRMCYKITNKAIFVVRLGVGARDSTLSWTRLDGGRTSLAQ